MGLIEEHQARLNGAAIVCPHVASGLPILYAERSEPISGEDSGWQFVCNSGRPEDEAQGQVWSLDEVLVLEPTLQNFITAPVGTLVYRRDKLEAWVEDRSACETGSANNIDGQLVGTWVTDPMDAEGIREFGKVIMEFFSDGKLTYKISLEDKQQIMYLTFRTQAGILITDQPSAPREERTKYSIGQDGKLTLWFGGQRSVYIRED